MFHVELKISKIYKGFFDGTPGFLGYNFGVFIFFSIMTIFLIISEQGTFILFISASDPDNLFIAFLAFNISSSISEDL